jgi:hypothetical protein
MRSVLWLIAILFGLLFVLGLFKGEYVEYVKEGLTTKLKDSGIQDVLDNVTKEASETAEDNNSEEINSDEAEAAFVYTQERNRQIAKSVGTNYQFKYVFRDASEKPVKYEWSANKADIDRRATEFGLPEDFFQRRYDSESAMLKIVRDGYFKVMDDNKVYPDYARIAKRNRAVATPIYKMLREQLGENATISNTIETLLRFCQDVPYLQPPTSYDGKFINGLDTPAKMLLKGKGDCDTKSVLFASTLLHDTRFKMIFVLVANPDHMFMAVRGVPNAYQAGMDYQGEKYIICEPVGEARLKMGQLAFKDCRVTHIIPLK